MSNFIETIVEKENKVLAGLEQCKENGFPTYLLGDGEGAGNAELRAGGFKFAGRLVNRKYYVKKPGVFCLEEVLDSTEDKVNLLVAHRGFIEESLREYSDKIGVFINYDFFAGNCTVDPSLMTYKWVQDNESDLERAYVGLNDDYSRRVMSAYINQKISSDYKYLKEVKTYPQYFEDIMPLSDDEVFIDCGAFDGDSAAAFISALHKRNISGYKKIISFEPDPINFEKLKKRGFENHECINKGTSKEKGELKFSVLGTSSGFDKNGEITVPIDSLDNEIHEAVTLIKMDIEGAELASLEGGKGLISGCKPKMAICIYHKKEDLWEIQNYLQQLVPEYKFYIRAYEDTATELVLYAIP